VAAPLPHGARFRFLDLQDKSAKQGRLTPMRRISIALLALVCVPVIGSLEAQTLKIGYIQSQEILAAHPGTAEAQAQLEQEGQAAEEEMQRLQTELQNMQQQLLQQSLTLSPEAKANREAQLQQRLAEADQRAQQMQAELQQRQAELVQPIMEEITAVIETIREEGDYSLILDVAAGSIISADPALDLTQEVIARLEANAGANPGAN